MTTSPDQDSSPQDRHPWDPFASSKLAASHGALALRALRFVAAFTRLQGNAAWYLRGWHDRSPDAAAANEFKISELGKLSDRRLVVLVPAAAADLQSTANLDAFKGTFSRVKAVRDHLVHAMFIDLVGTDETPSFGIPHYHGEPRVRRLEGQVSRVDHPILGRREPELLWLLEVVEWLAQESGFDLGPGKLNRQIAEVPRCRGCDLSRNEARPVALDRAVQQQRTVSGD